MVADNGAAHNAAGVIQANQNFGDIRFASIPQDPNYIARSNYPTTVSTGGGDIYFNTAMIAPGYNIGVNFDIYTIALHEIGHSLGLMESNVAFTIMNQYWGPRTKLTNDDIAGAQAIYGPRLPDAYDAATPNDAPEYASPVIAAASGQTYIDADLTTIADIDYYRVTVPAGAGSVLSVTAESGRSLLQPRLSILDANGSVLGEASAADYGQGALLQVNTVGTEMIIGVDSPVEDYFGSGVYRLAVEFRTSQDEIPYVPPTMLNPDAKEVNDSLAVATDLGQTSSKTTTGLNINWAWDEDFFKFKTANATVKNYEVSVAYTNGTAPLAIEIFNAAGTTIATSNGANYVRFPVVKNTSYSVRVYCPTRLLRGYSLTVKKYN